MEADAVCPLEMSVSGPSERLLSIVLPIYNEEASLPYLIEELDRFTDRLSGIRVETILVDDHSTDRSAELLRSICATHPDCSYLRLSINSGSHIAIIAGMTKAKGDCVVFMAADLQDPPELIGTMLELWEAGAQVVWAVREKIEGVSFVSRTLSQIFYRTLSLFGQITLPPTGADFALLDRRAIDAFLLSVGKTPSLGGVIASLGFRVRELQYIKQKRLRGRSKWTFTRKIKATIDAFVQFSFAPMRFMSYAGIIFSLVGFTYAFFIIIFRFFAKYPIEGWASLMVAVLITGGLQMCMLGVLGEYLWRNLEETRRKPLFFIEESSDDRGNV